MNTELFIAKHIISRSKDNFSRPIIKISIASIALGLAVMIIAVSVVTGFRKEVRNKVVGFGAHIQISNYDRNNSYEALPINKNQAFYPCFDTIDGIRHIQIFANKAGIVKTKDQIQGTVLKGIGSDYDWSFFSDKIIEGKHFVVHDSITTNDVLVSKTMADMLKLKIGDPLRVYFVSADQSSTRGRRLEIAGIYETGLAEFDELFIIGDIKHVQKLNRWNDHQIGGFEILIDDFDNLDDLSMFVFDNIGYDLDARSIKEIYPQIFDWLRLQDQNVVVILVLVILVASITMISTLLILILERTNMIGILKALGTKNISIRKIFLYNAAYIIGVGLFLGNLLGIGLCLLQQYTGLLSLDQESYYMTLVPINLNAWYIILLNIGSLLINVLFLIIPSYIITKITPMKAIRFS